MDNILSRYHCVDCGYMWFSLWDSACDDDCPCCGSGPYTPVEFIDVTQVFGGTKGNKEFYVGSIIEYHGEFESEKHFVFTSDIGNVDDVVKKIEHKWYSMETDELPIFDGNVYGLDDLGIHCCWSECKYQQLTPHEYKTMATYLPNATPQQ